MENNITMLAEQIAVHQRYSEQGHHPDRDVQTALGLIGDEMLLDVGCGTGEFLHRLRDRGHRGKLVGADRHCEATESARRVPGVHVVRADVRLLPFRDATFDRITAKHVLYYVEGPARALAESRRVCRLGGRVVVSVNHTQTAPRIRTLVAAHASAIGLELRSGAAVWGSAPGAVDSIGADTLPTMMVRVFGNVDAQRRDDALLFPTPESLLHYADVLVRMAGAVPAGSVHHRTLLERLANQVERWFATHGGPWRDPKGYSVFTSRV